MIFHKSFFQSLSKFLFLLSLAAICIIFTGCGSRTLSSITPVAPDPDAVSYDVGSKITVKNPGSPFTIQDIKDALAYDGMYYASWTIGDSIPYTNADGKEIDLFDAQLYMLVTENSSSIDALANQQNWYNSAKENYQVSDEYPLSENNIDYQIMTYTYKKDNPYERGVSAFASKDNIALCIELTARGTFPDDISKLMEKFLSNISN